jgi:hypothetical protein
LASISILGKSGIDYEVGTGATFTLIRAEEQGKVGHMAGIKAEF